MSETYPSGELEQAPHCIRLEGWAVDRSWGVTGISI